MRYPKSVFVIIHEYRPEQITGCFYDKQAAENYIGKGNKFFIKEIPVESHPIRLHWIQRIILKIIGL